MNIKLTFQWIDPPAGTLDSTGAFWISDDKDDLYGEFITDWFTLQGASVPDTTTSVNPEPIENLIKLHPNPTNAHLTIDVGDLDVINISINISNCLGQSMNSVVATQNKNLLMLNVRELTDGLYFIKILAAGRPARILRFVKT